MTQYFAYVLRYPDFSPYYVGCGQNDRPRKSLRRMGVNDELKKQGSRSVVTKIFVESKEGAFDKESELILQYGRKDLGTGPLLNRTNGKGSSGHIMTEKQIRQNDINLSYMRTSEGREKHIAMMKGNTYGRLLRGRKLPEKQKDKMRMTLRRKKIIRLILKYLVMNRS